MSYQFRFQGVDYSTDDIAHIHRGLNEEPEACMILFLKTDSGLFKRVLLESKTDADYEALMKIHAVLATEFEQFFQRHWIPAEEILNDRPTEAPPKHEIGQDGEVLKQMKFTCPRRKEDGMDRDDSPFALAGQNKDEWRDGKSCTYCGSLNQNEFMALLELGSIELTPTDKSYKVYVEGEGLNTKFYFQHLSMDQMVRFVELLNQQNLRLKYPGHFYVKPFFIKYGS